MKTFLSLALALLAYTVTAGQHFTANLLTAKSVVLTNNVTVTPATGVIYTNVWSILATNGVTNAQGVLNGPALTGATIDGELVGEANGIAPASLSITLQGLVAAATNSVTVTLVRATDGTNYGTTTQDQWAFITQQLTGLTPMVISTNMPSSFYVGTRAVKVYSILPSSSAGTNMVLTAASISGTYK